MTREKERAAWLATVIAATAIWTFAGCAEAEPDQPDDLPPLPVDAEDHLPDDIYSVKQEYQAHFDSVLLERATLLKRVLDGKPALDAYAEGEDARGNRFAADGFVVTQIEECRLRLGRFADETLPETEELLIALDRDQVGLARFKLRFTRFDDAWVRMNDCWSTLWADSTFEAWRHRHDAQADSMRAEEAARADARRKRAAADRAFRICVSERLPTTRVFQQARTLRIDLTVPTGGNGWDGATGTSRHTVAMYKRNGPSQTFVFDSWGDYVPDWIDRAHWRSATFHRYTDPTMEVSNVMVAQFTAGASHGCER